MITTNDSVIIPLTPKKNLHPSSKRRPMNTYKRIIIAVLSLGIIGSIFTYSSVLQLSSSSLQVFDKSSTSDAPWQTTSSGMSSLRPGVENAASFPANDDHRSNLENIFHDHGHRLDEADFIIQKSYAETYARMAPCENGEMEKKCVEVIVENFRQQRDELHSLQNEDLYSSFNKANNSTETWPPPPLFNVPPNHPLPWWFQTLLRDIPNNGAYGFWHHFSTHNPPIRFCAIGKNGSTEWRKVFKAMNDGKFNTVETLSENTPHTVFLRDPLERLLSGYLDKCVKDNVRVSQGHCEPNIIFGVDHLESKALRDAKKDGKQQQDQQLLDEKNVVGLPVLTEAGQDMDKEMFAAYVDLLPLKWNVHFVPQAIFCDLYRTIGEYDFIGNMGKTFMPELHRMATRYGGLLPRVLNETFQYQLHLVDAESLTVGNLTIKNATARYENEGADNKHSTKAPAKVARYYSPRAIRRALEYLSIDYVTLGFEVPEWAREMLRKDSYHDAFG